MLTEKLPGTSVDVSPNGYVFVRDGEADTRVDRHPSAGGVDGWTGEQLKEENWRQSGGEG